MSAHGTEPRLPQQRRLLRAQLPLRLTRLCRRGRRLRHDRWDVNTAILLGEDAAFLASACRALGARAQADALDRLVAALAPLLDPPHPPDPAAAARIAGCIDALARAGTFDDLDADGQAPAGRVVEGPTHDRGFPLLVTPPPHYWTRFDPRPPPPAAAEAATPGDGIAAFETDVVGDADARLAESLRGALADDGLQLVFQAIVPLHGEEQEQFQALLRLHDGDRTLTAAQLVPAAERGGFIDAVDRWALERCIALVARRSEAGHATRLFVSQSLRSARNAWAATRIERLLDEHKVAAAAISLDLRAEDAAAAPADVARYANAVKALGAGFVLSGFEAGPVAERLLATMPLDCARLAPRHLRLDDDAARDELRALVERLHERGCRVIAPRVEDARATAALWAAGVDYVQGNFVQPAGSEFAFDF